MALTPADVLRIVIDEVEGGGLHQAVTPLGIEQEPATRIDRSFSVTPQGLEPVGDRGRAQAAGFRVAQDLLLELAHKPAPSEKQRAPRQALEDLSLVLRRLVAPDTELTRDGFVEVSRATHRYAGSGAYFLTSFAMRVTYNLSLASGAL